MPTGKTADGIAMKFSRQSVLHMYGFKGYSSWYKIDEMVNNHSNSCK